MFLFSSRIQVIAIVLSIAFLLVVLEAVRRRRFKESYSLLWLLLGGFFLTLAVWREGLDKISNLIGIFYSPSMLFLFLLCSVFLILFQFSIILTRRSDDVHRLARELALAEERIRRLEAEAGKTAKSGEEGKSPDDDGKSS
jgi:hypothetical protein